MLVYERTIETDEEPHVKRRDDARLGGGYCHDPGLRVHGRSRLRQSWRQTVVAHSMRALCEVRDTAHLSQTSHS